MPASPLKKISLNLLIKPKKSQSFSEQIFNWVLNYGRYIIVITQTVVLLVFFSRFKLDREQTDLKETLLQKQAILESVTDLEKEIKSVQNKLINIRQATLQQEFLPKVLSFLEKNLPSDVTLTSLTLTKEKISFEATTSNLKSFSFLLKKLQENNRFTEIVLGSIKRMAGRIEFKIEAKINPSVFP